jgi:curved DNA-binding protein CbpA
VHGALGEKLLADIIRELGESKASGLLRLTQGKTIKAIFFESGGPIFAISNLAKEQMDSYLLQANCATRAQIDEGLKSAGKIHRLGPTLVEMGIVDQERMSQVASQLAKEIIFSLFEWTHGEFVFDERIKAEHTIKLEWNALDCILEGARKASHLEQFAGAVAPQTALVGRTNRNGVPAGFSGRLSPAESYLLSRLDTPTDVGELAAVLGLGQEETRKAVCALVSVGLLRVIGGDRTTSDHGEHTEVSAEASIADEIARKADFFSTADCYEMLGVTRRSTASEIKAAYYKLAKKFHPDRYRQAEHKEIHAKIERLFAKMSEAYEILMDPASRASYDEKTRKGIRVEPVPEPPLAPEAPTGTREKRPISEDKSSGPLAPPAVTSAPPEHPQGRQQPTANPAQAAEYYYQQGRSRNDQKDHYGAVTLLREAVKLDPKKPHYHFHLGVALLKNPRTRREGELHLVRAAELDPFNSQIRVRLGLLYKEAGLPKKSDHYFREALALDPDNRVALRELSASKKSNEVPLWKADIGTLAKKIFKK